MSNEDHAKMLYGGRPQSAATPPNAPADATDGDTPSTESAARGLYDATTDTSAPLAPGALHDPRVIYETLFSQHAPALFDTFGDRRDARRAYERDFVSLATELQLQYPTATRLYEFAVQGSVAAATGASAPASDDDEPPAAATDVTVRRRLREAWGEQTATDVLQRVDALIENTPELQRLFTVGHLRTNPEALLLLATHVKDAGLR